MNASPEEERAAKRAREALARLLRPRAELIAEKRAVVQELARSLGQDQLNSPISLVAADKPVSSPPSDAAQRDGKQREFIDAVQKNIGLRKELSELRAKHTAAAATPSTSSTLTSSSARADAERELLEAQLECNRLAKERERLEALNQFYEELSLQPAAAPDFLDPGVMFRGCAPFPELPKELVEGFTREEAPDEEARELVSRLRKATMRQKLVLEHDERKLEALRATHGSAKDRWPQEAQVEALNAVKNALVNWIETMLSKAGEGEGEAEGGAGSPGKEARDKDTERDAQLGEVEREYKRHIELRKQIMASMSQLRRLKDSPPAQAEAEAEAEAQGAAAAAAAAPVAPFSPAVPPEPQTYLLTPYLENLQALSREQKGLVAEKAHINATISRRQQETNKTLRRLAQESRLLSTYAPPPTSEEEEKKKKEKPPHISSLSFAKATKTATVAEQVQPWLFAADSAKIATLEAVAEAVDRGQVSIEDAMQALDQVSALQNKGPLLAPGDGEVGTSAEEDEKRGSGVGVERRAERKPVKVEQKSIWSILDGNLGLINE